jgi:hypothetical protein
MVYYALDVHSKALNLNPKWRLGKRRNQSPAMLVKNLMCQSCPYATSSFKVNLTKHTRVVHLQIKDKACPKCDFVTAHRNVVGTIAPKVNVHF